MDSLKKRKADDAPLNGSAKRSKLAASGQHDEVLGVALVGYGRVGSIHARNLLARSDVRLLHVVGRDEKRAREFVASLGVLESESVQVHSSLEPVLADGAVHAVVIASASEVHGEQVLAAVRSKKHVLCEKPVALDAAQVELCFQEAAAHDVVLLAGYQRRYDPSLAKIKKAIDDGAIGSVQLMRLTSRIHPPPSSDYVAAPDAVSFFDDFSTHDVDEACWLAGEAPEDDGVYACASAFLGNKTADDTAVLVLKFPSGALAIIENSRQSQYGYDVRLEVLGSNGSMLQLVNSHQSLVVLHTPAGSRRDVHDHAFPERFERAFENELDHWLDLCHRKQHGEAVRPIVSGTDCANTVRVTRLAQQVRSRQRSAVPLPPVPPAAQPYPRLPDDKVCVCLFGGGRMGQVRASAVSAYPNGKVKYIVDIAAPKLKHLEAQFNCKVLSFDESDQALNDPEVNAVIIATTSSSHCELITKSLTAGKHVFCEKPLALTYGDTQTCVDLAAKSNLALYCGFQRRSDVHFRRARELIRAAGDVHQIRVTSREPGGHSDLAYLLSSGGFLYDSVIHDIDMVRWLAGAEPIEVFCNGTAHNAQLREVGDIDSVVLVLRFASGIIATIDNHRHANYGYDQRIEVLTSQGMFQVDNEPQTAVAAYSSAGVDRHGPKPGMDRYAQTYDNGTRHFLDLLTGRETEPRVLPEDCTLGSRIADACKESLKSGKPVSL